MFMPIIADHFEKQGKIIGTFLNVKRSGAIIFLYLK